MTAKDETRPDAPEERLEAEDLFVLASSTLAGLRPLAERDPGAPLSTALLRSVRLVLGWVRQKALQYSREGQLHTESYRLLKDMAFDRRKGGDPLLAGDAVFILEQCVTALRLAEMRRAADARGGRREVLGPARTPRLSLVKVPADEELFGWDGAELRILEPGR